MTDFFLENINSAIQKRLLFVTGSRADFGKIEPLAKASVKAGLDITFFITGMHMMKRYGETRLEIKRFVNADFFEFVNQKEGDNLDFILSKTILGLSDFLHEHRPDLVVIHGDRVEALAASIACAFNYIPSAHVEGGEVSGTIDESIRHCNTKLCTTHFVSSEEARNRVLMLGENSTQIFNIGSPELDVHLNPSGVSIEEVKSYYEIPFEDYGIVIFHPITSERDTIRTQALSFFSALEASKKNFVVISPNNDPGTDEIFEVIEKLPLKRFRLIPSMRFNYFSELMKCASIIVGNSSAGVREAPFIGLPSINVGTRQNKRGQSASTINCEINDIENLHALIERHWAKRYKPDYSFGNGFASEKFVQILLNPNFWKINMQKEFSSK